MKKIFVLTIIATAIVFNGSAQLKLPAFFSDSMVLQQNTNAPVWGWAAAGEKVEVSESWSGKTVHATANQAGKWMVKLATPKAGGPYNVTIKANETVTLHGVLIGEVWICSGQSNMEMPLQGWAGAPMNNSATEVADANYPSIRLFTVDKKVAFAPLQDVKGSWSSCSPASAATFSATAYFFGLELYKHLHIPIGLIHTSWGGTIAEAWTSDASLRLMGDFNKELNTIDSIAINEKAFITKDSLDNVNWQKALASRYNNSFARSNDNWKQMELPSFWENRGLPNLDGIVWFKRTINIPQDWAGKDLKLDLGPIDDNDVLFLNDVLVDSTMKDGAWMMERHYTIPGKFVKAGNNTIAIEVIDNGGNGGLYGKPDQLNIYPADKTATDGINLSGEWSYKIAAIKPIPRFSTWPNQPSVLYNGMIAPLVPYAIKGAIWYQGESNVGRAKQYSTLFPLMITDWRKQFNQGNFPFYFVQIAPFSYGGDSTQAAALRDAQRRSLATPNTGMAVTMDIGEAGNIHPANKQDVGSRLALWALNKTYGDKNVVYSGPLYKSFEVKGNTLTVSFTNTEGGLTSDNKPLKDFELQGADGLWKPATAIIQGDKVVVTSSAVSKPVGVRYAYYSYADGSLFNGKGLPASSFTSAELN